MKIAIIGSRGYPYVYGGFETFVKELSERLVTQNVEVIVYCQKNLFTSYPSKVNGVNLVYIPTVKSKSLNQLVHCFLSMWHASFGKADVLLVVNLAAGPMGWIPKITGKKTMINVDGLEWLRPKWKGLGAKYFYIAAKIAVKLYDLIITDAEAMREVYLQEFKTDSKVIAYGAPTFRQSDPSYLQRLKLSPKSYYLIVGRLIPDNNADLIIKGFLKANSNKKLVVVGDVPYQDTYAESLKKLQNEQLIFPGYVKNQDELMALYQHSFAYIHGHKFGGTNPAMLKAMANNCAIAALNTPFNKEMLENGKFGVFFDENEQSVTDTLNKLELNAEKVDMMRNCVAQGLTQKYDWNFITAEYISTARKLIAREKI